MDNKNRSFQNGHNFLHNEEFIRWRLFQTEESDRYWNAFLIEHPRLEKALHEAIVQFDAVRINRSHLPEEEKKDIYSTVLRGIRRYERRMLLQKISSAVAIVAIAILSLLFITHRENVGLNNDRKKGVIVGETFPGEEIVLISGEERIHIAHKSHVALTGAGKVWVTDSVDSKKELLLAATEFNKLIVPYGKRMNLTLPDGTEVWLNSGTQLDFPSAFRGDRREIAVNGEIFIDVAHNPQLPFVVHAQDMDIRVHGTSFNISAYHDDRRKIVVLVDGEVEVKTADSHTTTLLPNEKLEITDHDIIRESINVSEYISWTKGVLVFNETPMSEILRRIERYYNVRFDNVTDVELSEKSCSGKLFLSNNLDSVMTSVSVLSSTVYQRENSTIHITKK